MRDLKDKGDVEVRINLVGDTTYILYVDDVSAVEDEILEAIRGRKLIYLYLKHGISMVNISNVSSIDIVEIGNKEEQNDK